MRSLIVTVALVVAAAAWACGGGSSYSTPTTPSGGGGGGTPAGSTIVIAGTRGAQSFNPNPASVSQGTTLSWQNSDSVTHHIVMNDGSLDTGNIAPGATSAVLTLSTNGGNYHCTIHPSMVGSINTATGTPPPCPAGQYCDSNK